MLSLHIVSREMAVTWCWCYYDVIIYFKRTDTNNASVNWTPPPNRRGWPGNSPGSKCLEVPGLGLARVTITRHLGIKLLKHYLGIWYSVVWILGILYYVVNQLIFEPNSKITSLGIYFIYGILFAPYLVLMVHCRQNAWCTVRHLPRYQVRFLIFRK